MLSHSQFVLTELRQCYVIILLFSVCLSLSKDTSQAASNISFYSNRYEKVDILEYSQIFAWPYSDSNWNYCRYINCLERIFYSMVFHLAGISFFYHNGFLLAGHINDIESYILLLIQYYFHKKKGSNVWFATTCWNWHLHALWKITNSLYVLSP